MLLENYTLEIVRPECNSTFQSLHCHAHLVEDIGEVVPYLNAVFGGVGFVKNPPSVTLQAHGRLITVHSRKISINALRDKEEALRIVQWLQREINEVWERRGEITPQYSIPEKPQPIEVLKLLPKTNCGECGQPTCLVFSTLVVQGVKSGDDCPPLGINERDLLADYLSRFSFF